MLSLKTGNLIFRIKKRRFRSSVNVKFYYKLIYSSLVPVVILWDHCRMYGLLLTRKSLRNAYIIYLTPAIIGNWQLVLFKTI